MNRFTVEETNLLSIYHEGSKAQLTENINATLPYMDADMRELAKRALSKVDALTEEEFCGACHLRRRGSMSSINAAFAAPKPESQFPCAPGVLQLR